MDMETRWHHEAKSTFRVLTAGVPMLEFGDEGCHGLAVIGMGGQTQLFPCLWCVTGSNQAKSGIIVVHLIEASDLMTCRQISRYILR